MSAFEKLCNEYRENKHMKDKIEIFFGGGESLYSNDSCVYMLGWYTDEDGWQQKLYAEKIPEDGAEAEDAKYDDDWGYDDLRDEIIEQAKEVGINKSRLIFPGKNYCDEIMRV